MQGIAAAAAPPCPAHRQMPKEQKDHIRSVGALAVGGAAVRDASPYEQVLLILHGHLARASVGMRPARAAVAKSCA